MRFSKPSPAMVVALIALFVALGGTSIAAVNFARNAGAVDGKSAVAASSTLSRAAGKLVATEKTGAHKGRIPARFLAEVAATRTFAGPFAVTDNAVGVPITLSTFDGIGDLTATCADQNNKAVDEDPITTLNLNVRAATAINVSKRAGGGNATVAPQLPNTTTSLVIGGSNTFEFHVQAPTGTNLLIQGVVRQDGRNTNNATCLVYGTILRVTP